MAELKFYKIKNLAGALGNMKKNIALVFWLILLIVLITEVFTVKAAVGLILQSHEEVVILQTNQGVRVNFAQYGEVVKRIEGARSFTPSGLIQNNPFGTK